MRRAWLKLRAYLKPSWRTLECPHCGEVLRERSGMHMTDAVGRHMRRFHVAEYERNFRRTLFAMKLGRST